jgi:hypothetical protein
VVRSRLGSRDSTDACHWSRDNDGKTRTYSDAWLTPNRRSEALLQMDGYTNSPGLDSNGFIVKYVAFIEPIGSNALLAYLLAYVAYFVPRLFQLTADGTEGWYGVMRSVLFAVLILAVVSMLTRLRFRLRV